MQRLALFQMVCKDHTWRANHVEMKVEVRDKDATRLFGAQRGLCQTRGLLDVLCDLYAVMDL